MRGRAVPHLVVLDLNLPKNEGTEVLSRHHARSTLSPTYRS